MARLFRLVFDSATTEGEWQLGIMQAALPNGELTDQLYSAGMFTQGKYVNVTTNLILPIFSPGESNEFHFGASLMPVVSPRIGSLIESLAPNDVQRIPVRVESCDDPYEILNVIALVDCIDETATVGQRYQPGDNIPPGSEVGGWRAVSKLVLEPAKTEGVSIFRPYGWPPPIIVSEEMKGALEGAGLKGLRFIPISDGREPEQAEAPAGGTPASEPQSRWREAVDAHCDRFLGPTPRTLAEIVPTGDFQVNLHPHPATDVRPWLTLRTEGVSEYPMAVPENVNDPDRTELMMYLPKDWDLSTPTAESPEPWWPASLLFLLGHFVHDEKTWFGPHHTVTVAEPGQMYSPGTLFSAVFLLPPPPVEAKEFNELVIDDIACSFLWVFPITQAEADLKVEKGFESLVALMQEHEIGHILDPKRPCMVTGHRPDS